MSRNKGAPTIGILLVVVGVILLLSSLGLFHFHWSYFLIIIGAAFYVTAFISAEKGGVFPGTILLLTGLFYLLRHYYILDDSMRYMWPVFPSIVGIAFLVLFIFKSSDWPLLIPGGICLFVGIAGFIYNYGYIYYSPWELISRYWPMILIIVGIYLISSRRS